MNIIELTYVCLTRIFSKIKKKRKEKKERNGFQTENSCNITPGLDSFDSHNNLYVTPAESPPCFSTSSLKTTKKPPPASSPLSQTEENQWKTAPPAQSTTSFSQNTSFERVSASRGQTWLEKGTGEGHEGGSITLWEAEKEAAQHSTGFGSEPCLCH